MNQLILIINRSDLELRSQPHVAGTLVDLADRSA